MHDLRSLVIVNDIPNAVRCTVDGFLRAAVAKERYQPNEECIAFIYTMVCNFRFAGYTQTYGKSERSPPPPPRNREQLSRQKIYSLPSPLCRHDFDAYSYQLHNNTTHTTRPPIPDPRRAKRQSDRSIAAMSYD